MIKILYEGGRSAGFIEYTPGEQAWRVVEAAGYLVIHCLWVVGRRKGKGYGSRLLDACIEDARRMGRPGVAMVTSKGVWLANEKVLVKNGFQDVGSAPPSFSLLVKTIGDGPTPRFPQDWDQRARAYGSGVTVVYVDQCPYMPDAVSHTRQVFEERGIPTRAVKLEGGAAVRARSPSAHGVFGIVHDGKLFAYHYLGKKEIRRLDEALVFDAGQGGPERRIGSACTLRGVSPL